MDKNTRYPVYFIAGKTLLAFIDKDKVYKIAPIGSNSNQGVTIDFYTTRRMVIQLWPKHNFVDIPVEKFKELYNKLFGSYLNKITL